MPAIIATVEWAARSGWLELNPPDVHAFCADLAECRQGPPDVSESRRR